LAAALLAVALPSFAGWLDTDRPGGKDHPLVSRYAGSVLFQYGEDTLGSAQVVGLEKGKLALRGAEGRISNRAYFGPPRKNPLDIFRNYQQALQAAGFETMFSCETAQCDKFQAQSFVQDLPRKAVWAERDAMVDAIFDSGNQPGFHYLAARKRTGSGYTYVQIGLVAGGESTGWRGRQFLQIIEPAVAESGKVTVDARAISEGLQRDGRIALYGVHFDTNKAVLREDSSEQLESMAKALKEAPAMKVFIVGHTDNQGDHEANMLLSQKRAKAVAESLSAKHGIAPARLLARGVADLSPISSNAAEEGRARNRRVELVVR
jgi:outer membrane protein OmpA-like peptidoglycan-associated protein